MQLPFILLQGCRKNTVKGWTTASSCDSLTPGRRQSKTLLTIDERGSRIARNSVFDCHLSPVGRQMVIYNSVSNDFLSTFVDCIDIFDCRLPGVSLERLTTILQQPCM